MMIKIMGLSIITMLVFAGVMTILFFAKRNRIKAGGCCGDFCVTARHEESGCNCQ